MGFVVELVQGGLGNMVVFPALLAGALYLFSELNLQTNARNIPTSAD